MLAPIVLVNPNLAQTPETPSTGLPKNLSPWMISSGLLLVVLAVVIALGKRKYEKLAKEKRFEEFKNRELQKKLKLALQTISKMERNPDLIHSREFNLDYLRMRMEEEQFKFAIVNQLKIKVKEKIKVALRPGHAENGGGIVGIASTGRLIDEIFDVEYDLKIGDKLATRVLFRVQIKLTKLPTQRTSETTDQIIACLTKYMSPSGDDDRWQPVIQSKIALIHWDQKAKPTPLLVLEQSNDGANVTYRTTRMAGNRQAARQVTRQK